MKFFLTEDNNGRPYVQLIVDSKDTTQPIPTSNSLPEFTHQCATLEQAVLLSREIQQAQYFFREEKMTYTASNNKHDDTDDDDDGDAILDDQ